MDSYLEYFELKKNYSEKDLYDAYRLKIASINIDDSLTKSQKEIHKNTTTDIFEKLNCQLFIRGYGIKELPPISKKEKNIDTLKIYF